MRVLAYTSPARGHLNPIMGVLLELAAGGAEVHVRTLSDSVAAVRAAGLGCESIDPRIEALKIDDYRAKSQVDAGVRAFRVFAERAALDAPDFEAALAEVGPDVAIVDTNTVGARAVAEREGIPWAEARPFLLEDSPPGVPPFGLGLRPMRGPFGRARDAFLGRVVAGFDRKARLPLANAGRTAAGLPAVERMGELRPAPLTLYFTARPFEYERPLPPGVRMVGAGSWDTGPDRPVSIPDDGKPLALVACSSEFQEDGEIAVAALEGIPEDWNVVVTSAAVDPAGLPERPGAIVERFLPHAPLLARADVVVCHGGMGVTQKALAHGVPVCVVPWGRDQLDVAAHVVEAGAGVRVPRKKLSPARLGAAVGAARECREKAERVRDGYRASGGNAAAAAAVRELLARSHAAGRG